MRKERELLTEIAEMSDLETAEKAAFELVDSCIDTQAVLDLIGAVI